MGAVSYLVDKGPHNWLTLESFDVKNHLCFWFQKFNSDIPKKFVLFPYFFCVLRLLYDQVGRSAKDCKTS